MYLQISSPVPGLSLANLLFGLLAAVSWPQPVAANWIYDYGVGITIGNDNNYRLTEEDEVDTGIAGANFYVGGERLTPTTSLAFYSSVSGTTYSDDSVDDSNDLELSLDWREAFQRSNYNFNVSYLVEPTSESEQLDSGSSVDADRDSASISVGYEYDLSQLTALNTAFEGENVKYDTDLFTDYQEISMLLGFTRQIDQNSSWSSSVEYGNYEPDDIDDTETLSFDVGYQFSTSATTTYDVAVGYSDVSGPDENDYGRIFSAAVSYVVDERNTFVVSIADDYQPTGNGEVRNEERAELEWTHTLSDRTDLFSSLLVLSADDLDYGQFDIGCGYRINREVEVTGIYSYRSQEDETEDADSDSVYVTLTYSVI